MKTIAAIAIAIATLQGTLASVSLPQCGVCYCFLHVLTFRDSVWFKLSVSRAVQLQTSSVFAPTMHTSTKRFTASIQLAQPSTPATLTLMRHSPVQTPVSLFPASTRSFTPQQHLPHPPHLLLMLPQRRPILPQLQPPPVHRPLIPPPLHHTPSPALQTLLPQMLVILPSLVQW